MPHPPSPVQISHKKMANKGGHIDFMFLVPLPLPAAGSDAEEGDNPPGGGANLRFCQHFPKNCMKLRKFLCRRGGTPLDPPLIALCKFL